MFKGKGQPFCFYKGLDRKYFWLCVFRSLATTELCCFSTKTATDNMWMNEDGSVPIKYPLSKQATGWIWSTGHHFSKPALILLHSYSIVQSCDHKSISIISFFPIILFPMLHQALPPPPLWFWAPIYKDKPNYKSNSWPSVAQSKNYYQ